ncbi:MAG: sugar ABC transporter ATP-binding protein [Janthinobacterium lividum]
MDAGGDTPLQKAEARLRADAEGASAPSTSHSPLVIMRGITKSFGPFQVLRGIDFDVRPGEVHALLGENGAGKSTLMKVLMGVHRPDAGTVTLAGQDLTNASVEDRMGHGIAMIFQELSLLPNMSVADNIMVGREPRRPGWMVDGRRLRRDAQAIIDRYGFPLRAGQLVRDLGFAQRQMVEILKAVSRGAKVLILDEPTSSLSLREEETLFALMDDLKAKGMGLVYISHRMAEIFRLANRLSIVKDGILIGPLDPRETSIVDVSALMSKAKPATSEPVLSGATLRRTASAAADIVLDVKDLRTARKLDGLRFTVGRGEIVGVAGLVGSGRSTLAKALFGLLPDARGTVTVDGRPLRLADTGAAIAAGLGFVPEDRRLEGLAINQTLADNVALPNLPRMRAGGLPIVSSGRIRRLFALYQERLGIVARRSTQLASELSGGNQQKVVFAKWLASEPKLLILDEPTNGVDVNAKADMRAIIRAAADAGMGVLLMSSELDELTAAADRILTLVDGRITRELRDIRDEGELRAILQTDLAKAMEERAA